MSELEGRTAVLTGAGKTTGIAFAAAQAFGRAGAKIVLTDVIDASEPIAVLTGQGIEAIAVECDVSMADGVAHLKQTVEARFGGCDILVHAATLFLIAPIEEITPQDWHRVVGVNLDAMYYLTHAFVGGMKERGWGRIIPISSNSYYVGSGNRVHYVSSKAALIGFTRGLAREVGRSGITVNAIVPGVVDTVRDQDPNAPRDIRFVGPDVHEIVREQQSIDMTLRPDHFVGPFMFLATDASAAMTGQAMLIDGGWSHIG